MFLLLVAPFDETARLTDQVPLPSGSIGTLNPAQLEASLWYITVAVCVVVLPALVTVKRQEPSLYPGSLVKIVTELFPSCCALRLTD